MVTGEAVPDGAGAFYPPTLLADVDERSEAYRDEIFGPVLTVRTHDGDDDALRQAKRHRLRAGGVGSRST